MRRSISVFSTLIAGTLLSLPGCSSDVLDTAAIHAPVSDGAESAAVSPSLSAVAPVAAVETAAGTAAVPEAADAVVTSILRGLSENHPDVLWDALPASYQRDVNELVHLAAGRLHPEAWRWLLQIAGKCAGRVRLIAEFVEQLANSDSANADAVAALKAMEQCARELERFSECGLAGLERLRSADMGEILQNEGRQLMPELWKVATMGEVGFLSTSLKDFSKIQVELKESSATTATIEFETDHDTAEIEFVNIEGKWVPRAVSGRWQPAVDAVRQALLAALPSPTATDNFGTTFQLLAIADFWVSGVPDSDTGSARAALFDGVFPSFTQSLILLGYIIGGPPSTDPDFHVRTKQSLKGTNKVVLVYCYVPKELKWDSGAVDHDIAEHVAHRLLQNKIKVLDPDRVHAWLDKNNKWKKTSELGKAFNVDYVVHIDVNNYSLFEPHSQNIYRGHADLIVNVVKMDEDKKDGNTIYTTTFKSRYPTRAPVDSNSIPFAQFKEKYLSVLSDEIGKLFYSVETGGESPYGVTQ